MIKSILIFGTILTSTLVLAITLTGISKTPAHEAGKKMRKTTITAGPVFSDIVEAKEWNTQSGQSFTKAKYDAFQSETSVKLLGPKTNVLKLAFDVTVEKGNLEVLILDAKGWVVFSKVFTKNEKGDMQVSLEAGREYDLQFVGKKATGSYLCKWAER